MFENHQYYNCKIQLDSGETFCVSANWIHNQQLDLWQGWQCAAGQQRLMIDENFDVFSGECLNDNLGNLLSEWRPLEQPTVCKQVRCTGCTDDLLIAKSKIINN